MLFFIYLCIVPRPMCFILNNSSGLKIIHCNKAKKRRTVIKIERNFYISFIECTIESFFRSKSIDFLNKRLLFINYAMYNKFI